FCIGAKRRLANPRPDGESVQPIVNAIEPRGRRSPCRGGAQAPEGHRPSTSLPAIALDLHEDPIVLKLALTSYMLTLAVFIPASGWVADRFGARTVFCSAIVVFTLGSILCGASNSLPTLIAARVFQGLGGAMMVPVGRLVLLRSVEKSDLVNALAYLTVPALIGPVAGPPLGGFITTYFHWRWIFWVNVPIGILGVLLSLRFIHNLREQDVPRFDFKG